MKYRVKLEYHSKITAEVEADNEADALEMAQAETDGGLISMNAELYDVDVKKIS